MAKPTTVEREMLLTAMRGAGCHEGCRVTLRILGDEVMFKHRFPDRAVMTVFTPVAEWDEAVLRIGGWIAHRPQAVQA